MKNIHLMKINTTESFEQTLTDLKVTDIVDFRLLNVSSIIYEMQNYFDSNKNFIQLKSDHILVPITSAPTILNSSLSGQKENYLVVYLKNALNKNYYVENISVLYDEDYEYNTFTEYNMDRDTISTIKDYENIEECLSEQKDCSYIERYSYGIYLEISLKEKV